MLVLCPFVCMYVKLGPPPHQIWNDVEWRMLSDANCSKIVQLRERHFLCLSWLLLCPWWRMVEGEYYQYKNYHNPVHWTILEWTIEWTLVYKSLLDYTRRSTSKLAGLATLQTIANYVTKAGGMWAKKCHLRLVFCIFSLKRPIWPIESISRDSGCRIYS